MYFTLGKFTLRNEQVGSQEEVRAQQECNYFAVNEMQSEGFMPRYVEAMERETNTRGLKLKGENENRKRDYWDIERNNEQIKYEKGRKNHEKKGVDQSNDDGRDRVKLEVNIRDTTHDTAAKREIATDPSPVHNHKLPTMRSRSKSRKQNGLKRIKHVTNTKVCTGR